MFDLTRLRGASRIGLTLLMVALALLAGRALWQHYLYEPWTRDARIRADIVTLAPEVAGPLRELLVRDNQQVAAGEVLLRIDPEPYAAELERVRALAETRRQQLRLREHEAARRARLGQAISDEERENAAISAAAAASDYRQAQAEVALAELNLRHTELRAPRTGQITNLTLVEGDYLRVGEPLMALVVADSFYVQAYLEETKLPQVQPGDPAWVRPMATGQTLEGEVESISLGITDRTAAAGSKMLADVEPTSNWVRLAQRIPVRIRLRELPAEVRLSAGMTASVTIGKPEQP